MDCRERPPGEHTDPAVSAAGTWESCALLEELLTAHRVPSAITAVMRQAHLEILRMLVCDLRRAPANAATKRDHVHLAWQYIAEHHTESLKAEMVAKHVGVCPQLLRKQLKRATGLTFGGYLTLCRLERAKVLLLVPGSKVITLSWDVGFKSVPTFYRAFRHHTGQSPTEYRQGLTRAAAKRS